MLANVQEETEKVAAIPVESEIPTDTTVDPLETENIPDDPICHTYDNNFSNTVMDNGMLSNIAMESIKTEKPSDDSCQTEQLSTVSTDIENTSGVTHQAEEEPNIPPESEVLSNVSPKTDIHRDIQTENEIPSNVDSESALPTANMNYRVNPELPPEASNIGELVRGMEKPLIYDRVGIISRIREYFSFLVFSIYFCQFKDVLHRSRGHSIYA